MAFSGPQLPTDAMSTNEPFSDIERYPTLAPLCAPKRTVPTTTVLYISSLILHRRRRTRRDLRCQRQRWRRRLWPRLCGRARGGSDLDRRWQRRGLLLAGRRRWCIGHRRRGRTWRSRLLLRRGWRRGVCRGRGRLPRRSLGLWRRRAARRQRHRRQRLAGWLQHILRGIGGNRDRRRRRRRRFAALDGIETPRLVIDRPHRQPRRQCRDVDAAAHRIGRAGREQLDFRAAGCGKAMVSASAARMSA